MDGATSDAASVDDSFVNTRRRIYSDNFKCSFTECEILNSASFKCVSCHKVFHDTCAIDAKCKISRDDDNLIVSLTCFTCYQSVLDLNSMAPKIFEGINVLFKTYFETVNHKLSKLDATLADVNKTIKEHSTLLTQHSESIAALESDVKSIKEDIISIKSSHTEKTGSDVACIMDEINQRESRSTNLIIFNMDESPQHSNSDLLTQITDNDVVTRMFSIFNNEIGIESIKRMGVFKNNNTRPVLVRLQSKQQVLHVLRNKSKLPDGVNVSADQTLIERKHYANLKKECDEFNKINLVKKKRIIFNKSVPRVIVEKVNSKNSKNDQTEKNSQT